jgi:hypothetical protein
MQYRVKLIIHFEGVADAHFWYRNSLAEAEVLRDELVEDLHEVEHNVFIYADTRHGHVRIR